MSNGESLENKGLLISSFQWQRLSNKLESSKSRCNDEPLLLFLFRQFDLAVFFFKFPYAIYQRDGVGCPHKTITSQRTSIQGFQTALRKCIIFTLAYYSSIKIQENNAVKKFAEKLLGYRCRTPISVDNLSIITMNWDAYLEKSLFQVCEEYNSTQMRRKVYPDLCFYDYCYDPKEHRIVSTHIKAKGHRKVMTTEGNLKQPSIHQGHDRALMVLTMIRLLAYLLTMVFYHRQVCSHFAKPPYQFCDLARSFTYLFLAGHSP